MSLDRTIRRLPAVALVAGLLGACSHPLSPIRHDPGTPPHGTVQTVEVLPADTQAAVVLSGTPLRLTAVLRDVNGDTLRNRPVTWTSADPRRLTVDASGVVTARVAGAPVRVTATAEGVTGGATLNVVLYRNDFEQDPVGALTETQLHTTWNGAEADLFEGRAAIVDGAEALGAGHSLRINYPRGGVGIPGGGAVWLLPLGGSYREVYASYRFRFGPGFDFVLGGKLPGLAGGAGNTGGNRPNGRDGWSGRMMWEATGRLVQYVYHPDQEGPFGDSMPWRQEGRVVRAVPDRWYQVVHRVVMNTPGQKDGVFQAWLDGRLVLDRRDLRFRDVDSFGIDTFQFSTFFGGNEPKHASTRDERMYFDDFVVSTAPPAM
jgi:hypothetical protein